jgi:anti-sigma regulatory factor (Ser/Thr protein kinase)
VKDLALHVMDIARNSVEARAQNLKIVFTLDKTKGGLKINFIDDGCGMDAAMVKRVTDPFTTSRTTRKVGLGLPLFMMSAAQTGGSLTIESEPGKGTRVEAVFNTHHIDCVPLGDLSGTLTLLISGNPQVKFLFEFYNLDKQFSIGTDDIMEALDGADLNQPKVIRFIKEMIQENLKEIEFEY